MIEMFVMMCLWNDPSVCVTKKFSTEFKDVAQCNTLSLSLLASVMREHEAYTVKKWNCQKHKLEADI